MSRVSAAVALLGIFAVAFAARALGLQQVFLDDGSVVFEVGDALYHVHRARFSFENFPDFLAFDPCLNHPSGSSVPYPPLPDLVVAGIARALGGSVSTFERVAAWLPAVLGSLAVLPIHALGRRLHGRGVGLGAAALLALAPIPIVYARVGYADHHAAVALLGAIVLAGYAAALDERVEGRARLAVFVWLTLARAALLLTWQGGLLYVGIGELAIALSAVLRNRPGLMLAQATSALAVIAMLTPFVAMSATPLAGAYSASELSRLHPLGFVGEIWVVGGAWLWERAQPSQAVRTRAMRALGLAALAVLALLALPGFVAGLAPAFDFLAQQDQVGGVIPEQAPLLSLGGESSWRVGFERMGLFLLLVPFVPLVLLARTLSGGLTDSRRFLFAWSLLIGVLAMQQVRYANDFAPVAAVGFALLLALGADALRRATGCGSGLAATAAVLVAFGLQLPALPGTIGSKLAPGWQFVTASLPAGDRALETAAGTQLRFAERVRAATPPASGCDGTAATPEYAVLVPFTLGHAMHYVGRRATPADNFGPYVGQQNFRTVRAFFDAANETEALVAVAKLGVSYVVTEEEGENFLSGAGRLLHRQDGSATDVTDHWGHFRLLAEGPEGGVPSAAGYGGSYLTTPPFKLFEVVEGATLEVSAETGTSVTAKIALQTPSGRRFQYTARGSSEADGKARLRLPYSTDTNAATKALTPYRVRAGPRSWRAEITDADIRTGAIVRLKPR